MAPSSFAVAHERVLARRRQRAVASAFTHNPPSYTIVPPALAGRLPQALRSTLASLSTTLAPALSRAGTSPSFRVSQLDSSLLDNELLDLFKSQVSDALKYYSPHLLDDYTDEITLFLRGLVFKLTIWDHGASYGASLQNLWYTDARSARPSRPTRWQKGLLGILSVGGPYVWQKWQDRLLTLSEPNDYRDDEPPPRYTALLTRLTSLATTATSLAMFASFALFLLTGKYATTLDRLLRLRLTPRSTAPVSRDVSFEYLNRQLVWHAFTEFLLFLLPLVGISRWRRWVGRAWRRAQQGLTKLRGGEDGNADDKKKEGVLGFLPERTCAICYSDQNGTSTSNIDGTSASSVGAMAGSGSGIIGSAQTDITNPYETVPCECVYCFVCLAQRLEAQDGEEWTCLRCGEGVTACRPWRGDVLDVIVEKSTAEGIQSIPTEKEEGGMSGQEQKYRSPSSSPRSSMSRGSKPSSPAKSVSFADSVIDNEENTHKRTQEHEHDDGHDHDTDTDHDHDSSLRDVDPMPVDDEDEDGDRMSVTSVDDLSSVLVDSGMMTSQAESGGWDVESEVDGTGIAEHEGDSVTGDLEQHQPEEQHEYELEHEEDLEEEHNTDERAAAEAALFMPEGGTEGHE